MAASGGSDIEVDGRRLRGQRNQDAVVEAILSLLEDGVVSPSANDIADRAGVSLRSVFRHFDDLDSLFLAGIQRQARKNAHLWAPPPRRGTVAARITALARQRRKLHEAVAPVRRGWMPRFRDHPTMVPVMTSLREELRRQVEDLFEPELSRLSPAVRRRVCECIEAAASYQTWEQLRFEQRLSPDRAQAVVRHTVAALLADVGIAVSG